MPHGCLLPGTNLFQENAFNQLSLDQKFRKLDVTQKRHVQNGGEKHTGHCKTRRKHTQKCKILWTEPDNYKQKPWIQLFHGEKVIVRPTRVPLVVRIPQLGSDCTNSYWCILKYILQKNRHSNTRSLTSTTHNIYKWNLTPRCIEHDNGLMGCYGSGLVPCSARHARCNSASSTHLQLMRTALFTLNLKKVILWLCWRQLQKKKFENSDPETRIKS